jgi:GAF domain-containing protein
MAELARSLATPRSVEDVLARVTATAVELLPGADTAGVLIAKGDKFESLFGTSDLVYKLDQLQAKYNEGPCVDAANDDLMLRADDFAVETRWPNFSRALVEIGVHSCLSFKLYAGDRTAGALNVFGLRPHVFTAESEALGSVLAAHAAAAILASRHSEQLRSAINSRDVIGQAKGVLMERFNVDALRAFEMLRKLSQDTNIKLSELAQRVVDTRGT